MTRANDRPRSPWTAWAIALALTVTGCTMCPDPFDYAGPVPNGSASQNDFMARSNGILPLRAQPAPWPQVVDAGGDTADTVAADDTPVVTADDPVPVETAVAPDDGDTTIR